MPATPDHAPARGGAREGRYLVFIPCLNDGPSLPRLCASLLESGLPLDLLVIDDGSDPHVDPRTLPPGTLLHRFPGNCGLGVSTVVALEAAARLGYAGLFRVDADGQHPAEAMERMVAALARPGVDLVCGQRSNHMGSDTGMDRLRGWVKRYYNYWARSLSNGLAPRDVNSGYMLIGPRAMLPLSRLNLGRFPEPQIYISAVRLGLGVASVDVEQRPREYGLSTLSPMEAARMMYRFNIFVLNELLRKGGR